MAKVHWLGAGLSSVPGIRNLVESGIELLLWNRTLSKAEQALSGLGANAKAKTLDWQLLAELVNPGDVVVSMLPASLHLRVASLCLDRKANFISSSYISPEMQALHDDVKAANLSFVNEVGLDPGIDHLLAHSLVHLYCSSGDYDAKGRYHFRSYCGGFPKIPNKFAYKFSWSPLGVLKALKSEACWLQNGETQRIANPWKAVTRYTAVVANGETETFEAYPNRDSLPFMKEYGFDETWHTREFVRGTLRLSGWSEAWKDVFDEIEPLRGKRGDARLAKLSDKLWSQYAYEVGEHDRVVLCVELEVHQADGNGVAWHKSYDIDECENALGSAMGRLVSSTVSLAVSELLEFGMEKGVTAAPKDPEVVNRWLDKLRAMGTAIALHDRLKMRFEYS